MEEERVVFNVRGTKFEILASTLNKYPESLLARLDKNSQHYDDNRKEYFFDRDPYIFNYIINCYKHGSLHVPKHICVGMFREEMKCWGINQELISECCWRTYYQLDVDKKILDELKAITQKECINFTVHDTDNDQKQVPKEEGLRYRIWRALDQPGSSRIAMAWHICYLAVVILSAIIFCLWTLDEYRTDHYLSPFDEDDVPHVRDSDNKRMTRFMLSDPILVLFLLDVLCFIVFTLEMFVHIAVVPSKTNYFRQPLNIVAVFTVLIAWVVFAMEFHKSEMANNYSLRVIYFVCRALTLSRLLLFLRLEKQFPALRVLILSMRSSFVELLLMIVAILFTTLIFASLMYFAEIHEDEGIHSIFIAMWWSIITMTTVGYGDHHPKSTPGYVVGAVCAICGVIVLALPIAVIASNFSEYYSKSKDQQKVLANMKIQQKKKKAMIGNKVSPDSDRNGTNGIL